MIDLERLKRIMGKMFSGKLSAEDRMSLADEHPFDFLLKEQWDNGKEYHEKDGVNSREIWNNIAGECWGEKKEGVFNGGSFFLKTIAWTAVSAVVLIAVWLIGFNTSYITVKAPLEGGKMTVLPDSSEVWLNASASIRYREDFVKDRKVELEGEAFFKVMKMDGVPFVVYAGGTSVEVRGTEFNIKRMPMITTVTLFTGSVEFSASKSGDNFLMKPGEQISCNMQTGEIHFERVDVAEYDWRAGKYKFVDKPLKSLIDFINRNYDVSITLGTEVNEDILFTGTIRKEESLMDVLDKICISMELKMRNVSGENIELY